MQCLLQKMPGTLPLAGSMHNSGHVGHIKQTGVMAAKQYSHNVAKCSYTELTPADASLWHTPSDCVQPGRYTLYIPPIDHAHVRGPNLRMYSQVAGSNNV